MATPRTARNWRPYLKYILLIGVVMALAVSTQFHFLFGIEFKAVYLIAPTVVSLLAGLLLGRLAELKERLRRKSLEFRAIVDIAKEFTYLRRVDGHYDYVSPSCLTLTGYSQEEFYATPSLMDRLIHPEDRHLWRNHVHHMNEGGIPESLDLRLITKGNVTVWFNHICTSVFDDQGRQIGVRSINLDITQRKSDQEQIERMALFDPLTELPNRRMLNQRLQQHIEQQRPFAILFLDLNRFKHINDSLGHSFGDRLLREIANRLRSASAEGSLLCRFGGDEFVAVHPKVESREAITEYAETLLGEVERPLHINGSELLVSGSIGITFYPEDGDDAETLIRNADAAMYKGKRGQGHHISLYRAEYSQDAAHFVSTENSIYKAIQQGEFIPFYQPKVDLRNGAVCGLEALARWQHPTLGMIAPQEFIPIAEETGRIIDLGMLLLERILNDLAQWRQQGIEVPIAFNVSARQLTDPYFTQRIETLLQKTGCPASSLELEITEHALLNDIEGAIEKLGYLHDQGMSIALDDFGTGYSSLSYLRRLPIDTLKIDRSFVSRMDDDPFSRAILRAITGMCRELNLGLIAEGVETEPQRQALLALDCCTAQGFLFHRPQPAGTITQLLNAAATAH